MCSPIFKNHFGWLLNLTGQRSQHELPLPLCWPVHWNSCKTKFSWADADIFQDCQVYRKQCVWLWRNGRWCVTFFITEKRAFVFVCLILSDILKISWIVVKAIIQLVEKKLIRFHDSHGCSIIKIKIDYLDYILISKGFFQLHNQLFQTWNWFWQLFHCKLLWFRILFTLYDSIDVNCVYVASSDYVYQLVQCPSF